MEKIEFTNTMKVLEQFGEELVEAYKAGLTEYDAIATHNLINSVTVIPPTNNNGIMEVSIQLMKYWKFVEAGRRKGKMPPVKAIDEWIVAKGLSGADTRRGVPNFAALTPTLSDRYSEGRYSPLAWAIATHIKNDGIDPKPILKDSIKETLKGFRERLSEALVKDVSREIGGIMGDIWSDVKLEKVDGEWKDIEIREEIVL